MIFELGFLKPIEGVIGQKVGCLQVLQERGSRRSRGNPLRPLYHSGKRLARPEPRTPQPLIGIEIN